jgi:hypothetical protein
MKKYLFLLVAASVAFASCEKKQDPTPTPTPTPGSDYTAISFKQSELSIAEGETARLILLWEPSTIELAPVCEWSSSDTTIATVANGVITAIKAGDVTITAKHKTLEATCQVNVRGVYDLLTWAGMSWWSAVDKKPLTNDTIRVKLARGDSVSCVPTKVYFRIWGEGIYYDAGLKGEGIEAMTEGMGLLITDSLDQKGPNFYILGYDLAEFVDADIFNWNDTAFLFCIPTGKLNFTAEEWFAYLTDETEQIPDPRNNSSFLDIVDFDAQEREDGLIGVFNEGAWIGDDDQVVYANASITWFDGPFSETTPSYYGLLLNFDEATQEWDFADPKTWAPKVTTRYNFDYRNAGEEGVRKYKLIPADREIPAKFQRNLDPKVLVKK